MGRHLRPWTTSRSCGSSHRPPGPADARSCLPGRSAQPPDLRVLRRAHGALCLHRHLRADHPTADEHGFRGDVRSPDQRAGADDAPLPRWQLRLQLPLGGRGRPEADRPAKLDFAWRALESNQVGTDDFLDWCARLEIEPMMAVNLGTRGIGEALELLQYVNGTEDTTWPRPAGRARAPGTARRTRLVPGQRDGRRVADGPQDRQGVCPARRGDGSGDAALRRRPRAGGLRVEQLLDAHLRHLGADGPGPVLRPGRPHLRSRLLRAARGRRRLLPGLRGGHATASSTPWSPPPRRAESVEPPHRSS